MATKTLSKRANPGAIHIRTLIRKFEAIRYLTKLAYGVLQFNADGDLVATDQPTVAGLIGTIQALSGPGAVNLTTLTTAVTTTGADALTLADGVAGQIKVITLVVDGGDATLTPATVTGYSTITLNDAGDSVTLQFHTTRGWVVIANNGCTLNA